MQQAFLSTDNKLVRIIVEPRYRWLRHMLLCLLLLTVSYENVVFTYAGDLRQLGGIFPVLILIQFALYLSFYLNIYVLVPRFFLRARYIAYILSLWALLSLNFAGSYCMEYVVSVIYKLEPSSVSYIHPARWFFVDYISAISVTGMSCLGTTITILFRNWLTDGKRKQEMESEQHRKGILKFKDTVSPAFLSEILLTAARHTEIDGELSADILTRLSRFLRYRLYDSNREVVFFNSEADFLDNYLSLVGNLRPHFSSSVGCHGRTARTIFPPSVLFNVTEAILQSVPESGPLKLVIDLEAEKTGDTTLAFSARSAEVTSTVKIKETVTSLLDVSFPSGYSLEVAGGGDLTIHIRIPQHPRYGTP